MNKWNSNFCPLLLYVVYSVSTEQFALSMVFMLSLKYPRNWKLKLEIRFFYWINFLPTLIELAGAVSHSEQSRPPYSQQNMKLGETTHRRDDWRNIIVYKRWDWRRETHKIQGKFLLENFSCFLPSEPDFLLYPFTRHFSLPLTLVLEADDAKNGIKWRWSVVEREKRKNTPNRKFALLLLFYHHNTMCNVNEWFENKKTKIFFSVSFIRQVSHAVRKVLEESCGWFPMFVDFNNNTSKSKSKSDKTSSFLLGICLW